MDRSSDNTIKTGAFPPGPKSGPVRIVLFVCGALCVALGFLGMFLPVLPTTPFLLLAAFCFARSSSRFYEWLMTNRWCGKYIRNYREGRGLPFRQKVQTLVLLWMTIGISSGFFTSQGWLRIGLLLVAAGVTIHLVRMKTCKPEEACGAGKYERTRKRSPAEAKNGCCIRGNPWKQS